MLKLCIGNEKDGGDLYLQWNITSTRLKRKQDMQSGIIF